MKKKTQRGKLTQFNQRKLNFIIRVNLFIKIEIYEKN